MFSLRNFKKLQEDYFYLGFLEGVIKAKDKKNQN